MCEPAVVLGLQGCFVNWGLANLLCVDDSRVLESIPRF